MGKGLYVDDFVMARGTECEMSVKKTLQYSAYQLATVTKFTNKDFGCIKASFMPLFARRYTKGDPSRLINFEWMFYMPS